MVPDIVYNGKCEVELSEDNIVLLPLCSLEQSFMKTAFSMIIVVSTLSDADKGFLKSKGLFKIFRVNGFSLMCCRLRLTGLVGLFFDLCPLITAINPKSIVDLFLLGAEFSPARSAPLPKDDMERPH